MNTTEALKQLRDDIKEWVTNNLNAIGKFSGKASDITLDPIDGSDSTNAQEEFERLNSKLIKTEDILVGLGSDYNAEWVATGGGMYALNVPYSFECEKMISICVSYYSNLQKANTILPVLDGTKIKILSPTSTFNSPAYVHIRVAYV